jgi:calcineurin-like phosphoesterase family protein
MNWLTADLHFGHRNIIPYCKRPYPTVETMDDTLAANWRQVVSPGDTVYVLGDMGFIKDIPRLPGHIVLIGGNHDSSKLVNYWLQNKLIHEYIEGSIELAGVRLQHIPDDSNKPTYCGHVHEKWRMKGNCLNVGVDVWQYRPISQEQAYRFLAPTVLSKVRKTVHTLFGV